jgi:hypothetical protein
MVTRLYFHSANSAISGTLPSLEQSALSPGVIVDDQTVNRSMSTTVGVSQATLSAASIGPNSSANYYFTRFVSPLLNQTSISSGTWTYGFATNTDSDRNNFPVSASSKPVRVNCYVWKPSDGTKIGTILDGNTASTVSKISAGTEAFHKPSFTGSAVSGFTAADAVIIFEVWFQITTATSAPSGSNYFYYDGTTTTATEGNTIASAASYIETNQTISFIANLVSVAPAGQTVSVSDSAVRTVTRQTREMPLTETLTLADSIVTNVSTQPDNIEEALDETISISDSVGILITRNIPINIERVMDGEDLRISDFTECHFESGTIIYTGDPSIGWTVEEPA